MGLGKIGCGRMHWGGIPRYGIVFTMGREEKGKNR